MKNDIETIEKVVGKSWEQSRKNLKWVCSQNFSLQHEHARERKRIYHFLKSRSDLDSTTIDICANFIAAAHIRDKYSDGSVKKDISVGKVPDTIETRIKKNATRTKKPVIQFLLERIDIVRQLLNNGYSYRRMKIFIDKTFPRKKLEVSHTSIRTFVHRYILEGEETENDV